MLDQQPRWLLRPCSSPITLLLACGFSSAIWGVFFPFTCRLNSIFGSAKLSSHARWERKMRTNGSLNQEDSELVWFFFWKSDNFKIKGGWLKAAQSSVGISTAISREDSQCSQTCKYCLFWFCFSLAKQIEPYRHN